MTVPVAQRLAGLAGTRSAGRYRSGSAPGTAVRPGRRAGRRRVRQPARAAPAAATRPASSVWRRPIVSGDLDVDGDLADGLSAVWSATAPAACGRARVADYPRLLAGAAVRLGRARPPPAAARRGRRGWPAGGTPGTGTARPSRTTTTCRTSSTSCCSTTPWPTPARTSTSGGPTSSALDDAQRAKLDLICRKLGLAAGRRHLDIGCGWGSLVCHAAEHYGTESTGVTLSRAQYEFVSKRVADGGPRPTG